MMSMPGMSDVDAAQGSAKDLLLYKKMFEAQREDGDYAPDTTLWFLDYGDHAPDTTPRLRKLARTIIEEKAAKIVRCGHSAQNTGNILTVELAALREEAPELADKIEKEPRKFLPLLNELGNEVLCREIPQIAKKSPLTVAIDGDSSKNIKELRAEWDGKLVKVSDVSVQKVQKSVVFRTEGGWCSTCESMVGPLTVGGGVGAVQAACPECKSQLVINADDDARPVVKFEKTALTVRGAAGSGHVAGQYSDIDATFIIPVPKSYDGEATDYKKGGKVSITGVLRFEPSDQLTKSHHAALGKWYIEVSCITNHCGKICASEEDIESFEKAVCEPGFRKKFIRSINSDIFGNELVKEGIAAVYLGGTRTKNHGGNMHLLVISNGGLGKTETTSGATKLSPGPIKYASGKSTSSAGLVGGLEKSVDGKGFEWVEGILAACNQGSTIIDEIDKMPHPHIVVLNDVMQSGTYTSNKAGQSITSETWTSLICLGNSRRANGRYDYTLGVADNTGLPLPFLSRVDQMFVMTDPCDDELNEHMSLYMAAGHAAKHPWYDDDDKVRIKKHLERGDTPPADFFDPEWMRKYIDYARKTVNPEWHEDPTLINKCIDYYVKMRNFARSIGAKSKDIYSTHAIVTLRSYLSLLRAAEFSAKMHLESFVRPEDVTNQILRFKLMFRTTLSESDVKVFDRELAIDGDDYPAGKLLLDLKWELTKHMIEDLIEDNRRINEKKPYTTIKAVAVALKAEDDEVKRQTRVRNNLGFHDALQAEKTVLQMLKDNVCDYEVEDEKIYKAGA